MLFEDEGTSEEGYCVGVSLFSFSYIFACCAWVDVVFLNSLPAALQYEKFLIPDPIRIMDAIVETLNY